MEAETETTDQDDISFNEKLWLIRPCKWYDDEYYDCKTVRSRFHQYFVFGELTDCAQWKRDSSNCYRWNNSKNVDSAKELIESEQERRKKRLQPFFHNDVWENRTEPPENWNAPLPEWMQKEHKNSYLGMKVEEEKNNISDNPLVNRQNLCLIM